MKHKLKELIARLERRLEALRKDLLRDEDYTDDYVIQVARLAAIHNVEFLQVFRDLYNTGRLSEDQIRLLRRELHESKTAIRASYGLHKGEVGE